MCFDGLLFADISLQIAKGAATAFLLVFFHFFSYIIILQVVTLYRKLKPHESVFDEGRNRSARRKPSKSG